MGDGERLGVQQQARGHRQRLRRGIEAVAKDRMPQRQHMHAQLVRPSGNRLQAHAGGVIFCVLQHLIFGLRRFAGFIAHLLLWPVRPVANQR